MCPLAHWMAIVDIFSPQQIVPSSLLLTVQPCLATSHHSLLMLCSFTKLVLPQCYLLKH